MNPVIFVVGSTASLAAGIFFAVLIPGIERKIHARIQQRYGPPLTTPGLWNILKFAFKRDVKPDSPSPTAYHSFILLALAATAFTLMFSTPYWWGILGFGSVLGLVGLLKVEEVSYVLMGSFSKSVMSVGMPCKDRVAYASFRDSARRCFEEFSAVRAFKMITLGSFPFYVALFVPFAIAGGIGIADVLYARDPVDGMMYQNPHQPILLTIPGLIAAIVYFIGYNILTNNRPFDIIKPKVDVIEGPVMEYAAVWRGLYYLLTGLLSFTLSSIFVTLFMGIPFDVMKPEAALVHLALVLVLPACAAMLRAFSPVFTFRQIYFVSASATLLGLFALALSAAEVLV